MLIQTLVDLYIMTKTNKKNVKGGAGDFRDFIKQLPSELREMLNSFNVSSFEDLLDLSVMVGIDPDKFFEYSKKHGTNSFPSMEEVAFDDDDPAGAYARMFKKSLEESDGNEDYFDPFLLPERIFFEDKKPLAYHVRIKLCDAPVPIWRELEVPSNITLEFFAFVVIDAMGWENEHLHQFTLGNTVFKSKESIDFDEDRFGDLSSMNRVLSSDDFAISTFFKEKGDCIRFEYDFGDGWLHEIWLKGIREYGPEEEPCLKLLKGMGQCPPEDCGGVYGYGELLELLAKKRKTADDKERLQWYKIEKGYDPNEFDFDLVDDMLYCLWADALR